MAGREPGLMIARRGSGDNDDFRGAASATFSVAGDARLGNSINVDYKARVLAVPILDGDVPAVIAHDGLQWDHIVDVEFLHLRAWNAIEVERLHLSLIHI